MLFPGGDSDYFKGSTFGENTLYIYEKIKKLNDQGTYFPLWGTCQGFE